MPDNQIQIAFKVDIKELNAALQQGASAVQQHTDDMAKDFKKLAKESKTAIEDLEKAAKLADVDISEEMKSVLEQVPKLAAGIGEVLSGGGVLAFLGVLLEVGKALKGLYDEVIALKGAKEEWAEINKRLADAEETLQGKMRRDAIEYIRLTQGEAAAAHAALRLADKEVVEISKNVDQILAGKKIDKLSEGLRKDLENLKHFTFEELSGKIKDVDEAIKRAEENTKKLNSRFLEALSYAPLFGDLGKAVAGYFGAAAEKAEGELKILKETRQVLVDTQKEHKQATKNDVIKTGKLDAEQQMRGFKETLQKQKDALDAFHTMSKQAEVEYWDNILATHKLKGQNLTEVQHLRWEAQKEADRQGLQDEVERTQDEVAASKAGSQQRVQILDGELAKMEANHQTETAEYKRLVKEWNQAVQDAAKKELKDEVEKVQEQVKATKAGSEARIKILHDEIVKLENEKQTDTEEYKRLVNEEKQAVLDLAKAVEDAQKEHRKGELQHDEAVKSLAKSRLDFQRQIGNISESEYEARMREEINATFEKAHAELVIERDRWQQGTKEYEKAAADVRKLEDKHAAEIETLEQKSYLRRTKNIDAFFSHVKSAMDQSISGFLKGTESFAKAWQDMWSDMVISMVQKLADMMLKWIQHHVTMLIVHATAKQGEVATEAAAATQKNAIQASGHMKEITRTAERAAGHAYDAVVNIPIVGPVLAPVAAGVAFAAVEAFGMMSAEGGQYLVPGPQLTMLHPQEMVLPAGLASRMRDVVDGRFGSGGGGALTVVVNHSVNAMDAESFQGVIRRHGNIIGNEVARVLKKKGFASR